VRRHPDDAHVDEARTITARLRQEAQAKAARQAEQVAWDATDRKSKAALQDFLSRYANGVHAQDARGLISGIEREESDALAATQQASRAAADQQSVARFLAAYEAAYNRLDLKTLQGMWNPMPKKVLDETSRQFRDLKSLTFQMRPLGQATVNGDSAVVACTRTLSLVTKSGDRPSNNERVRVSLRRAGSGWVISSIDAF
jgi:hypothetical protein